jgi:hypothetical protein
MQTWEDTETGTQVLLREIGQLSEEIENLRVITEQVAIDSAAIRSATLG